jgi:hypothetical protein
MARTAPLPAKVNSPTASQPPALPARSLGPAHLVTFVICCAGLFGAMRPSPDPDSWWHLATGDWILDHGAIPSGDPFSWTAAGREWVAHEWASEIVFKMVDSLFGALGLVVMQGLFVGAGLFLLRRTLRRVVQNEWIIGVGLAVALYLSSLMWSLRPHLVSLVILVFFLDTLIAFRAGDGNRRIWMLVPATMVWANLHAGFLSGVLLVWIFAIVGLVERRRDSRRLLTLAILVTLAGAANPVGFEIYAFSVYLARVSDQVVEWQPPGIRDPLGFVLTTVVLVVPTLFAITRRRCDPALLGAALVFGALALGASRNIWLAGVVIAPALALAIDGLHRIPKPQPVQRASERYALLAAHVLVVVAGAVVIMTTLAGRGEAYLRGETAFPKAATEALRDLPPGRLLNPYDWGGYLIWKTPDFPVSADGRADLYGDELLEDVQMMERLEPGWDRYLDEKDVDYVLWQRKRPLAQALRLLDDWSLVHQDEKAVLFSRTAGQ